MRTGGGAVGLRVRRGEQRAEEQADLVAAGGPRGRRGGDGRGPEVPELLVRELRARNLRAGWGRVYNRHILGVLLP